VLFEYVFLNPLFCLYPYCLVNKVVNIQTGEYGGDLDCQHSKGPMSHSSPLCHNTDASIHLSFHPFTKPANTATSSQWFNSTSEQICLSICQLVIYPTMYLSFNLPIHPRIPRQSGVQDLSNFWGSANKSKSSECILQNRNEPFAHF